MGAFKSERRFWTDVTDLRPVVEQAARHFRDKGYTVGWVETGSGAWDVDITRTGVFRTVAGLRTALKVRLEPEPGSVLARAGVGILGQQALPTVVTMLVFWPVIVTQIWGAVRSAKIDDEALAVIERALTDQDPAAAPGGAGSPAAPARLCPHCDAPHSDGRFCTECGGPLVTG